MENFDQKPPGELIFHNENGEHKYTLDGEIIPSVGQVLDTVYQCNFFREGSMEKGTYLHKRFEEYVTETLNKPWIEENAAWCLPYIEQFKEYYEKCLVKEGHQNFVCEVMSYSSDGYAGTIDLVSYKDTSLKNPKLIVDYKTCRSIPGKKIRKKHAEQVAAYVNMIDSSWNIQAQVVYITDKQFKIFRYGCVDIAACYRDFYEYLINYKNNHFNLEGK
jgi:hypothetical protein